MKYILEVNNLSTAFKLQSGWYAATIDISFSLMGLLPEHGSRIESGTALFKGEDLLTMSKERLRKIRGSAMTMIFQEPMTSLNPVLTVGSQIAEAVYYHMGVGKAAAKKRALELMDMVKIR